MAQPSVESSVGSEKIRRGAWCKHEDELLRKCVETYGEGNWHLVPRRAGLKRCRKSCRLRWLNYLNPKINRGRFSADELDLITRMHRLLGNRWSLIAGRLPGRTANDVKNYWNSHLAKGFSGKPASATAMEVPPTLPHSVVYRPQAHRVSMRTRELLRRMFGSRKPNPKPPETSSQLPDITGKPSSFPAPQPSSSQPTELPHAFPVPDPSFFQPPSTMETPHPFPVPEPSFSQPPSTVEIPRPFPGAQPSSSDLSWLPADLHLKELAPGGGGDFSFNDVDFDDLFYDSFLWEWINDNNGSSLLD